jgi:hypothetical protein
VLRRPLVIFLGWFAYGLRESSPIRQAESRSRIPACKLAFRSL